FLCVWGAFVAWGGVVPLFGCRGPLALRQGDWVMVAAWGWGDGVGAGAASGAGGLWRGRVGWLGGGRPSRMELVFRPWQKSRSLPDYPSRGLRAQATERIGQSDVKRPFRFAGRLV